MRTVWVAVAVWSLAAGAAIARQGAEPTGSEAPSERTIVEAFDSKDYARALELLESASRLNPRDPATLYNRACAQAMLGLKEEAARSFYDAVASGFVDFFHAERDPHLDAIRDTSRYGAVINGWPKIMEARGAADLKAASESLGPGYRARRDSGLRISYLSALEQDSFDSAAIEIERVARWAGAEVLPAGWDAVGGAERPDPWVLVVLPTQRDFAALVPFEGVGGYYDRDRKRLIAQDIGATLRHEFFHVLHWRHMDRLGQRHPYWVMEGLASVLEDVEDTTDGGYAPAPSWRTNIVKRLERANRLIPLEHLASMPRSAFVGDRSRANYAQSRALFMFLLDQGLLREWYRLYTEGFDEDETGLSALSSAAGVPLQEFESRFRRWVRDLPEVAETARPADASLGVEVSNGPGDGIVVAGTVAASAARRVGDESLRRRDAITSIDGRPVRNLDDLQRLLTGRTPGERVTLQVRRGTRRLEVVLELVDRNDASPKWP